ncbi:MAG: glycine cleavage system protein H, partial [Clostridiales bacterium]|nr:glycine cleavage system protein H [Clostridiales bacterium]
AYGAWIVKVKDVTGLENLLDADQYADLIKEG